MPGAHEVSEAAGGMPCWKIGCGPWPAPAPAGAMSSTVPYTARASTITEVTMIQVAWILVLPWIGAASVSSPGFCRQKASAQPKYSSTPITTGVAIVASTVMSICWLAAVFDASPGGHVRAPAPAPRAGSR